MGNKMFVPLCGIDESMVGFSINGWEIKKILPSNDKCTIVDDLTDATIYETIHSWLEMEEEFSIIPFTNDRQNPYYLIFVKETDDISEFEPIVDVLRVVKSSQFGCWQSFVITEGAILPSGKLRSCMTDVLQIRPLLSLSLQERIQISKMLQMRMDGQFSPIVRRMLLFFHDSCRSSNQYISFILRVTILEMLIDGNAELSYRLKRSVAVLLGRDREESEEIAKNINAMYKERSKFLHNGDTDRISEEYMQLAYEYSRRVIANLICISDSLVNIRITLEQAGYGENPYNVTM